MSSSWSVWGRSDAFRFRLGPLELPPPGEGLLSRLQMGLGRLRRVRAERYVRVPTLDCMPTLPTFQPHRQWWTVHQGPAHGSVEGIAKIGPRADISCPEVDGESGDSYHQL